MNGSDTHPATREQLIAMHRGLSAEQRLARTLALSGFLLDLVRQSLRERNPEMSADELADRFLRQVYGPALADRFARQIRAVAPR